MNIKAVTGVYRYPLTFDYGRGTVPTEPIESMQYTHEITYKDALYLFGVTEYNTYCLVHSETGAVAVAQSEFKAKTTNIEKYISKLLEKEGQYGSMPEVIQRYKLRINILDLWQTKLFIG